MTENKNDVKFFHLDREYLNDFEYLDQIIWINLFWIHTLNHSEFSYQFSYQFWYQYLNSSKLLIHSKKYWNQANMANFSTLRIQFYPIFAFYGSREISRDQKIILLIYWPKPRDSFTISTKTKELQHCHYWIFYETYFWLSICFTACLDTSYKLGYSFSTLFLEKVNIIFKKDLQIDQNKQIGQNGLSTALGLVN